MCSKMRMSGRLIVNIVSTVAEEAAILFAGVWLLPEVGVRIPLLLLAAIMLAWLGWTVFTYRKGSRALERKPVRGLMDMQGMKGVVVRSLRPDGVVKVSGELWNAHSVTGPSEAGADVIVVSQEGLKLIVKEDESR
jgi:membrane-bound ClpP family serine protease